jgi:hypothetical protein
MKNGLTALLGKFAVCVLFAAVMAGCGTTTRVAYPLNSAAAYPFDDFFFKDQIQSERALVLVGSFGDEVLTGLQQTNSAGLFYGDWIIPVQRRKLNDVYLIPITIGKDFYIDSAKVAPNPKASRGIRGEATVRFKNPKTIRIDKPGIYYYGKIIFNDGKAYVATEVDQRVIDLAIQKYPKVFTDELARINF